MKKTTLRQAALRLALVAFVLLAPLGLRAQQSLPYSYGFEDNDLSADGWTTQNPSGLNNSELGINSSAARTDSYGFRFSSYNDNGTSTQYLISPELSAPQGVVVSFFYKSSSTYSSGETFKVGYSTTNTDVSSFTWSDEYSTNAISWSSLEETFPAGTKYIAIYYYPNYQYRLYIDDISLVNPPSCIKPTGLTATLTPGDGSVATLSWTKGGEENNWVVEYSTASDFSGATQVTSGFTTSGTNISVDLTGLTAEQTYYARVKANCGGGDVSEWSSETGIYFTPTNQLYINIFGQNSSTSYYLPSQTNYDYSYTQQIYTATEMGGFPCTLKSVAFKGNTAAVCDLDIYLVNTTKSSFTGTSDYIAISEATLVYSGEVTFTANDWTTIAFDNDFDYTGGNLAVIVDDNSGNYTYGSTTWQAFSTTTAQALYFYQDNTDVNPASPSGSYSGTPSVKNQIKFSYEMPSPYTKPQNLTVTNLTANGATITWEAPNTDVLSYKYQYREQGGTWSALTSTTTLSAPLTSLTGNTTYEFQVQALYAGNNESAFASTSFTTPCAAFSVDPTAYTYGFETAADMDCWTLINGVTYTGAWDNATINYNYGYDPARTGDNLFMFYYVDYDDTDPEYQTLISPELTDVPSTGLHVEFYYVGDMSGGGQETFRVGYSTTNNDLSSFTWGSEIDNASTAYQRFSANYPAGTKYVAIQHTSDDQFYLFIDDITFEGAASCLEPTAVTASNITTTGAQISWTAGASETAWDIYYTYDYTDIPDDATSPTMSDVSTPLVVLNGAFQPATTYYVYVRAVCGTDHSVWSTPLTFHTECEGMDLPYSYGFEDGALSVCWNVLNTNTSYNSVSVGASNANTGTHSLNFYRGSTIGDMVAVLPEVGAYDLSDYQFEFSAKGAYAGYEITVGIMTDPDDFTTFVPQGTTISTTTDYAEYKVRFNEYTGSGKYVAISVVRPSTVNYGYIYIDDIAINPIPSCIEPDGLTVSNETAHGATFAWNENASATAWQLYISENSTAPSAAETDVIAATSNPFTLTTGLDPETDYYVWVRANCGTDGYSIWVGPETFTTAIACPAPTGLTASNVTNHTAQLAWTGSSSDGYNVRYRTAAYLGNPVFTEEFNTSSLPTDWARSSTALTNDVLSGTTALTLSSSGWSINSYGLGQYNVKMNLYSTYKYWLISPSTTLGSDNMLSFDAAITAYNSNNAPTASNMPNVNSRFVVLITTDNMATWTILREWNNTGSADVLSNISNTGNNFSIDLSAYSGETVRIAFYGGQAVSGPDCDLHIDNVAIGEAVAAGSWQTSTSNVASKDLDNLTPEKKYEAQVQGNCGTDDGLSQWTASTFFTTDIACPAPTTLAAGTPGPDEVELSWTDNGTSNAWVVSYKKTTDATFTDVNVSTNPYTLTGLDSETEYTVKVKADCTASSDGYSEESNPTSFTTAADCPVPVLNDGDITNVSGHTADVAWTGFPQNDSYKVWYRMKEHINGVSEEFNSSSLPTGWSRSNTALTDDVLNGTTTINSYSGGWSNTSYGLGSYNWKMNIYSTGKYWLITPSTILADGSGLSFDAAITAYNSNNAPSASNVADANSRFVVLITTDDMATWTILREWNNTGSADVLNDISNTGNNFSIDLSSYAGETVKIAFYGGQTSSGPDCDLHIDNVIIGVNVPAGTWQTEDVAAPATSTTLTGLDPETPYEVYVTGHCATGNVTTVASATQTFTTTVACPAPTSLQFVDATTTTATISWTGTATAWVVEYKAASDADFTPVNTTENPYTIQGLTPSTNYTVRVKADCSANSDGYSEWSNTIQFATECEAYTIDATHPYNQNFETPVVTSEYNSTTDLKVPVCWVNPYTTSSSAAGNPHIIATGASYNYSADQVLNFYGNGNNYITLPEFTNDLNTLQITFKWATESSSNGTLYLGYITDGDVNYSTFTEIKSFAASSASHHTLKTETVYLTNVPAAATRLAFRWNYSGQYSCNIDDVEVAIPSFDKAIEANKWYAISSPVHNSGDNQTLAGVTNLTSGSYDLFGYTESAGTWNAPTVLEQGKGYIYRAAADATLNFVGTPNSGTVNANVTASCADNDLKGFNLVGNPYPHTYSYSGDYYSLNTNGTWQATTGGTIGVAEGFLVKVSASGTIDFTESSAKGNTNSTPAIAFTVSNEEFEDVAYARLDNGEGLPKIGHLNSEAPMLSIPVDGRRYAIADLGSDCESFDMNFRGFGEYTITVNCQLSTVNYLHLLDRTTGRDIDLLRQPSYTFNATGSDAGRFLVKLTPDTQETSTGNFAYLEGHNWVVEGNGMLQVFDILGRRIMTKEVNSQLTIPTTQFPAAGVYILRLGEKSQKIVVK